MRNKMKKIIALILCLAMVSSFSTVNVFADTPSSAYTSATAVDITNTLSGSFSADKKANDYKFTLNDAGSMTLKAISNAASISYTIYDCNGKQVWTTGDIIADTTVNASYISEKVLLTAGDYYLECGLKSGDSGSYSVKFSFTKANESFAETLDGSDNNPSTAHAISLLQTYRGQIANNDGKDFYKLTLNKADTISISATSNASNINYTLYDSLYDVKWESKDNAPTDELSISQTNASVSVEAGTYYFAVYSDTSVGNYAFIISHNHSYSSEITKAATYTEKGVRTYTCDNCGSSYTEEIETIAIPQIELSTVSSSSKGVSLTWKKISGATQYVIYRNTDGSTKYKKVAVTKKNSYVDKTAKKNGQTYYYRICSYIGAARGEFSSKQIVYYLSTPSIKSLKNYGSNTATNTTSTLITGISTGTSTTASTISGSTTSTSSTTSSTTTSGTTSKIRGIVTSWKANKKADGYEVQYSAKKTFKTHVDKTTTSTSYTRTDSIKAGQKYYVRIRSYKVFNGVKYYSDWSKIKSIKVKK